MPNDCLQWLSGSFRVHQIRFRPGLCLAGLRGPTSRGKGKERGREVEGKKTGEGQGGTAPLPFRKFLDPSFVLHKM